MQIKVGMSVLTLMKLNLISFIILVNQFHLILFDKPKLLTRMHLLEVSLNVLGGMGCLALVANN